MADDLHDDGAAVVAAVELLAAAQTGETPADAMRAMKNLQVNR